MTCFPRQTLLLPLALAGAAVTDLGASSFSESAHHAWSATGGWISLRQGTTGVAVHERFLAGWAWEQNTGWIGFGDGSPANGHAYANDGPEDFGVNLDAGGRLLGFAWSPNAGWIHFEQVHGKARLDFFSGRLEGYAWSQNLGWINLGQGIVAPVAVTLIVSDSDGDGLDDAYEALHFGDLETADETTDSDRDGQGDLAEAAADTDPNDPADFLRITRIAATPDPGGKGGGGTTIELEWTSSPRRSYLLLASENPSTEGFEPIPGRVAIEGFEGLTDTLVFPPPGATRGFWRVQALAPFSSTTPPLK